MPENRKLDSVIQIDGENYEVVAETAKKLANALTIQTIREGEIVESRIDFDGSEARTINVGTGDADKIQVSLDNNKKVYATITISSEDPVASEGSTGNIWFKY